MSNRISPAIEIIGVPFELGANIEGIALGPQALRNAFLHEALSWWGDSIDNGDIICPKLCESRTNDETIILTAKIMHDIMNTVLLVQKKKALPVVIGGDHTLAIGSVSASAAYAGKKKLGLIWIDAHADFNTPETTLSDRLHGMPLAVLTGHGYEKLVSIGEHRVRVAPHNISLVGLRAVDPLENTMLHASGINCFKMQEIRERGIRAVTEEAIARAACDTDYVHLSIDLDSLDPYFAPGVSVTEPNGLSLDDAKYLLKRIGQSCNVIAVDLVELNPLRDQENKTALCCIDLVTALMEGRASR